MHAATFPEGKLVFSPLLSTFNEDQPNGVLQWNIGAVTFRKLVSIYASLPPYHQATPALFLVAQSLACIYTNFLCYFPFWNLLANSHTSLCITVCLASQKSLELGKCE